MAVGSVHHRLIDAGLRCDTNLIIETGSARNPHHYAVLIGYGATAVYPYLAYEIINEMVNKNKVSSDKYGDSVSNYIQGINKGILKIMSNMGISCVSSYRGAQLFEIVGLDHKIVELCFKDTCSVVNPNDGLILYSDINGHFTNDNKEILSNYWSKIFNRLGI